VTILQASVGPADDRRESLLGDIAEGTRLLRGIGLSETSELASSFATTTLIIGKR